MSPTSQIGHSRASAGFLALTLFIVATPIPSSEAELRPTGDQVGNAAPAVEQSTAAERPGPFDPGWQPEPLHDARYYRTRLDGRTTSLRLDPEHIAILSEPLEQSLPGLGIGKQDVAPIVIDGWSTAVVPDALRTVQGVEALLAAAAERPQVRFVSPVLLAEHFGPLIVTPDILVGFQPGVDAERARAVLAASNAGAVTDAALGGIEGLFKLRSAAMTGLDVLAAANALARHPDVRFAEPDMIFTGRGSGYPTDPGFALCWGLHNSGAAWDADIDAPQAWEITTGDPSITVVIIDTGVDPAHPDINQVPGVDTTSQSAENPLGAPVSECDNHGTPVAGCVSAMINGIGTVGVAPDCTIASGRSFISNLNCGGSWSAQFSWSAETIGWAHANGARVTNNSNVYGGPSAAVEMAYETTRLDGVVHFAAAGNDPAEGVRYPASLPTVNAVAALAPDGDIAGFSAPGAELAIAAPGQALHLADRTGAAGWVPGDYVIASGTSFASPYAAGVAALILSASPELSALDVESLMYDTAVDYGDPGFDTSFGHGVVNACAALGGDCGEPCAPDATGGCFESGAEPGCNAPSCCTAVCLLDPSCCEVAWDETCVELALATCVAEPSGPPLTRVSVSSAGEEADHNSHYARVAADAWHIVAFESLASNLVDGDVNDAADVFVHNLVTRDTALVSVSSDGTPGNGDSWLADISHDGRWVVFFSDADNLVESDTNTVLDVFVHDRHTGTTVKMSTREDGAQASDQSYYGVISADGRYVAFLSDAGNLVAGTADDTTDVLLHDRDADGNGVFDEPGGFSVTVVSVNDDGDVADGPCGWPVTAEMPRHILEIPFRSLAMSDDASCITFYSSATNLGPNDTNDAWDVFVHDRNAGTTRRVSVA
ncbi:MAG: S8 family serine peptidase, partial [Planctomycetota bacterium]